MKTGQVIGRLFTVTQEEETRNVSRKVRYIPSTADGWRDDGQCPPPAKVGGVPRYGLDEVPSRHLSQRSNSFPVHDYLKLLYCNNVHCD